MKRRLTPFYVLNMGDESMELTGVIEMTNLIDRDAETAGLSSDLRPALHGQLRSTPSRRTMTSSRRGSSSAGLLRMFPDVSRSEFIYHRVHRTKFVQPLPLVRQGASSGFGLTDSPAPDPQYLDAEVRHLEQRRGGRVRRSLRRASTDISTLRRRRAALDGPGERCFPQRNHPGIVMLEPGDENAYLRVSDGGIVSRWSARAVVGCRSARKPKRVRMGQVWIDSLTFVEAIEEIERLVDAGKGGHGLHPQRQSRGPGRAQPRISRPRTTKRVCASSMANPSSGHRISWGRPCPRKSGIGSHPAAHASRGAKALACVPGRRSPRCWRPRGQQAEEAVRRRVRGHGCTARLPGRSCGRRRSAARANSSSAAAHSVGCIRSPQAGALHSRCAFIHSSGGGHRRGRWIRLHRGAGASRTALDVQERARMAFSTRAGASSARQTLPRRRSQFLSISIERCAAPKSEADFHPILVSCRFVFGAGSCATLTPQLLCRSCRSPELVGIEAGVGASRRRSVRVALRAKRTFAAGHDDREIVELGIGANLLADLVPGDTGRLSRGKAGRDAARTEDSAASPSETATRPRARDESSAR